MSTFQHEAKWEIIISFGNNLQIQIPVLLLREIQTTGKLHRACQDSVKIRPVILRLHLWWQWSQAKLNHLMVVRWGQILILLLVKAYRNFYKDKHIQIIPKIVKGCSVLLLFHCVGSGTLQNWQQNAVEKKKWIFMCNSLCYKIQHHSVKQTRATTKSVNISVASYGNFLNP